MQNDLFHTLRLLLEDGRCPVSEHLVEKVNLILIKNQVPFYLFRLNDRKSILELNVDQPGMQTNVDRLRD